MFPIRVAALCSASFIVASTAGSAATKQQPATDPAGSAATAPVGSDSVADPAATPQTSQDIVVQGYIGYRNRSNSPEPVLVYDTDYFQRFEPLTAGDALKRVPSVTFLSDVIESDGARLRGLDPGYTQILINGDKVPGSNADRSFFLDRIPAELIDRVEIVRSNSARRSADAMAGTLNIVLRDAFELEGGYLKAGGLRFDDGELKPSLGAVWGGRVAGGRLLLGANVQGRYNPKEKVSLRYGDSPENVPDYETEEFDNREDQDDTRNGTDYSFNGSYGIDFGQTRAEFEGFYVKTDRKETERSFEYDDASAVSGPIFNGGNLLTDNGQVQKIDQESYSVGTKLRHDWAAGRTSFKIGYSRYRQDSDSVEGEIDFDVDADEGALPEFEGEQILTDIVDREFSLGLDHKLPVAAGIDLVVGAFYQDKDRDSDISVGEAGFELTAEEAIGYDQFDTIPSAFDPVFENFEAIPGGLNEIEEKRRDLFALIEGKTGIATWEAGVRFENTDLAIDDLGEEATSKNDYSLLLPSASVKLAVTPRDRITASVARTNRRPRFDYLSPATLEEELGDNDLRGNPTLRPETAWGADLGYERRIGRTGVAGVNVFYRKVSDLVEIANTGEVRIEDEGTEDEESFPILQPQNSGDGKAWGIEFDLSTSLGFVGLSDTGIFGNLALLDSEIEDFAGERRFNGQPRYVYNVGFIHNLTQFAAAFGVTYRKQGPARDRIVGEEVRTTYGADLEAFVEKRLFGKMTVRAVGSNLLNGKKKEAFNKFDSIEDQLERDFDEYELEAEEAGPVFQLVARLAF
jgi:hypothetical protein